jgi:predicted XRE-type DNA-binding protein
MMAKPLRFVGSSLDDLRNFPDEARRDAGFQLRAVQSGLDPSDWRSIHAVGPGVKEIRIHILGEWRIVYVVQRQDIELARRRYGQIGGRIMSKDIVNSSGNTFADLGFSPEEAAILQMRADLMAQVRKVIQTKKLTQAKAAKLLGVSQSRVSDLVRGKWEKFSLEMLITLATRAGIRVRIKTAA